jgi:Uma2 family endonuclease
MIALPKQKMTVDEYLAWAEGRPGRFELYADTVYAMTPERAGHAKVKYATQTALLAGIRRAGVRVSDFVNGRHSSTRIGISRHGKIQSRRNPAG